MYGCASGREYQHMQLLTQKAERLVAWLWVGLAPVFRNERGCPIEVLCQAERQAAERFVFLALGHVVAE